MSILYRAIKEGEIGLQIQKEGEKIGELRGEALGEARGEARGEEKGLVNAIMKIWEHRFGTSPDDIQQVLHMMTPDQLLSFLQQSIDVSEDELRRQLGVLA